MKRGKDLVFEDTKNIKIKYRVFFPEIEVEAIRRISIVELKDFEDYEKKIEELANTAEKIFCEINNMVEEVKNENDLTKNEKILKIMLYIKNKYNTNKVYYYYLTDKKIIAEIVKDNVDIIISVDTKEV